LRAERPLWADQFQIQSEVDLDFVIGQKVGYPVGMQREAPAEFRRRVLAGLVSYQLRLKSIDHALKRYVEPDLYESEDLLLGDAVSDYLRESVTVLMEELRNLHTEHPAFGTFGAEITLYRLPHSLDTARMLSNRGLLLEVLPILRLCLEMMAWSNCAFHMQSEDDVTGLKAQSCISELKSVYETVGKIYGYLSKFSHWGHIVHGHFLDITPERIGVLNASVRYRAMALALCLVILDILVEVVRGLYPERSNALITKVQGVADRSGERRTHRMLSSIAELTGLNELREIQTLLV
jgi:hypothetical protein